MGFFKAISTAVSGTLSDQWKDIITAGHFDEHTVVVPGCLKNTNNGRGENTGGSMGVISNGSKIYVPENTAAFVIGEGGIENLIRKPGAYEYQSGEGSVFNGDGLGKAILKQVTDRIGYGGVPSVHKEVAFVNLREIRNIKFGTRGPQIYNDRFYGCDLEIYAYGSFTMKVVDPEKFICNFVPPNTTYYSFDNKAVRDQLLSDFTQSFIVALNTLSKDFRISQIPGQANQIATQIASESFNAGTWPERFGFQLVQISIENIELSPESRELINKYNANKMDVSAYENVSQRAADIAARQKIAAGIQNNGFGDAGGTLLGLNLAREAAPTTDAPKKQLSFDEQIETLKKLKELVDMGILSQEEFEAKKKEIMNL